MASDYLRGCVPPADYLSVDVQCWPCDVIGLRIPAFLVRCQYQCSSCSVSSLREISSELEPDGGVVMELQLSGSELLILNHVVRERLDYLVARYQRLDRLYQRDIDLSARLSAYEAEIRILTSVKDRLAELIALDKLINSSL